MIFLYDILEVNQKIQFDFWVKFEFITRVQWK